MDLVILLQVLQRCFVRVRGEALTPQKLKQESTVLAMKTISSTGKELLLPLSSIFSTFLLHF